MLFVLIDQHLHGKVPKCHNFQKRGYLADCRRVKLVYVSSCTF